LRAVIWYSRQRELAMTTSVKNQRLLSE